MSEIQFVDKNISIAELKELAKQSFGDMVKAVADLEKRVIAFGGELHADEEAILLQQGSKQENLWGFNIYVDQPRESWLEYNSMINIRPSQNNSTRDIQNQELKDKITEIVNKLVK
ncbi:MAG: DUF5674 family protein [Candidatus Doudnabacteria bacterium]